MEDNKCQTDNLTGSEQYKIIKATFDCHTNKVSCINTKYINISLGVTSQWRHLIESWTVMVSKQYIV